MLKQHFQQRVHKMYEIPEGLGDKQRVFTRMVADLILFAYEQGYELTFGDAYRDPRVHGNIGVKGSYSSASSNHKRRLAVDFNLFKNGQYLTATEDHRPLGEFWESIGGTWGGRFNDGNHYSLEHDGRK
ncbi:MAG: M15 family metallopeptidase [Pseudomonadota bacterium]